MDTVTRYPERARTDREDLDRVLDSASTCTFATVLDGRPWLVPMLYARDGDRILLHGSTGAGALRHVMAGAPVAVSVMLLDGIVVAEDLYHSSANYRSAVVRGTVGRLGAAEALEALNILSDRLIPGRSSEVPAPTSKQLAATAALALPILPGQWTAKVRDAPPTRTDIPGPWSGVVPLRTVAETPVPAPWISDDAPLPLSVQRLAAID
ncbi:pyridoxamine 5'-phosphate oxidase family protein [Rhodococcus artemisiae]|uniref:Pyridoxamine 5'-phosphate oxidase family protein n=1 Tax=Rhodococcus artemisiae TaxID=714159 RepID=A0ABU7LA45_9NOCA|nr:pyridoxamine 5'-phosphate oxidase family protein [Rhodococcus artemisiae]MEE2058416.1 pyridoxamine 5'-phosphate oxidase family protein [Rhodococcus artemisiae]